MGESNFLTAGDWKVHVELAPDGQVAEVTEVSKNRCTGRIQVSAGQAFRVVVVDMDPTRFGSQVWASVDLWLDGVIAAGYHHQGRDATRPGLRLRNKDLNADGSDSYVFEGAEDENGIYRELKFLATQVTDDPQKAKSRALEKKLGCIAVKIVYEKLITENDSAQGIAPTSNDKSASWKVGLTPVVRKGSKAAKTSVVSCGLGDAMEDHSTVLDYKFRWLRSEPQVDFIFKYDALNVPVPRSPSLQLEQLEQLEQLDRGASANAGQSSMSALEAKRNAAEAKKALAQQEAALAQQEADEAEAEIERLKQKAVKQEKATRARAPIEVEAAGGQGKDGSSSKKRKRDGDKADARGSRKAREPSVIIVE